MNGGSRNNAPGNGVNAGSSSGKSDRDPLSFVAFTPVRDGAKNKSIGSSSSNNMNSENNSENNSNNGNNSQNNRNNGSNSGNNRNNGSNSQNNRNNGSNSGNNRNNGSNSGNNRNNGSSSQSRRDDDDGKHVPGTNVVRVMRTVLPAHAKIHDAAKEAMQECVTEYISLITGEANERCMREHRKTLTPEDLLYAMAKLGFDEYIQPLTLYLNRYREFESQRTSANGEPSVYRTVNYQYYTGLQAPPAQEPPPPPPPSPVHHPLYLNPQVSPPPPSPPPPPMYFINNAEAMRGFQGFPVTPPAGSIVDITGPSTSVAHAPAPAGSTGVYPYNEVYPPPPSPGDDFSRQFFK